MREVSVLVGQSECRGRVARRDVAEDVAADQRADPLPVRVAVDRRLVDTAFLDEVAVGRAFGGVGLVEGQPGQPFGGDVGAGEVGAVLLQDVQAEDGVVHVVVARRTVDVAAVVARQLSSRSSNRSRNPSGAGM